MQQACSANLQNLQRKSAANVNSGMLPISRNVENFSGYHNSIYENPERNFKNFPCPNCPSAFTRKNGLICHLRFECGQPPRFKCPYCDYRSKKSSNVQKHVHYRTSAETTFVCPQCKRNFRRMKGLKQHMTYECNRLPRFQCPYCCQRSKLLSNLYKHIRRIHAGNKVWGIDLHQ
ncbi:histone-lysine N-methyltransferase PRDM16-like [Leptopilina boulardi]|uniref:histone-lysine N-methyltransferase PRDM16-like n=1 Tax=Leptopilina boulardi TaxID=63433 RepID=UPI0021F684AA|nr:histone-lysine N-methyltransferase PRDM16-like [Leptopilina boulardi]